jgi:Ca2+-binding RTX toxin-like protein
MSFVITDTSVVFTDPTSVTTLAEGSNPNEVDATTAAVQVGGTNVTYTTLEAAAGTTAQVVVSGAGTRLNVGNGAAKVTAVGGGQIIEAVDPTTNQGARIIKLGDDSVAYNSDVVNNDATVAGNAGDEPVTIAQAAGGQGGSFAFYAHSGAGNDQIEGSSLSDFIRGGAGNDEINSFGGNDLIRGGSGSDTVTSGPGADTLYYTADQLDGSEDTFVDFSSGEDKISFDSTQVASLDQISGLGTKSIFVSGADGTVVVTVTSQNDVINGDDINFV